MLTLTRTRGAATRPRAVRSSVVVVTRPAGAHRRRRMQHRRRNRSPVIRTLLAPRMSTRLRMRPEPNLTRRIQETHRPGPEGRNPLQQIPRPNSRRRMRRHNGSSTGRHGVGELLVETPGPMFRRRRTTIQTVQPVKRDVARRTLQTRSSRTSHRPKTGQSAPTSGKTTLAVGRPHARMVGVVRGGEPPRRSDR